MRRILVCGAVALVPMGGAALAQSAMPRVHTLLTAGELKWGEPPPVFEKGMSFTVVSGDPGSAGHFVVRLRMPRGYKIAPHWHPTDERVTVLSGTLALGMGDRFDKTALKELPAGGYAVLPADMRHFAMATSAATVQVEGAGPFTLTYVNSADDPSRRSAGK